MPRPRRQAEKIGPTALPVACDVTDAQSVRTAFDKTVKYFGGVDIAVSNAGAAWQGRIGDVAEDVMRKSFELNFYGHQRVAQAAVKIMLAQGTGGCLLFNVSKQAVNPGPNFGPYGIPKAATLALMRQYALDYGGDGIRANAVNADRIRSGLLTPDMIASRSKARGLSEKDYMSGNLLGREVTAEDVAQAFLHQALELKTTASRHHRRRRQHRRGDAVISENRGVALMKRTVVRYKVKPDRVEENVRLVKDVFAELQAKAPQGVRYMTLNLGDGTFVHFATSESDDNPIPKLDAFKAFTKDIAGRCIEQPQSAAATVVGNYRMIGE